MSKLEIHIEALTSDAFASFGDVLEAVGEPTKVINRGMCERFHDLANIDCADDGTAGISIFQGKPYNLPLKLEMVERHPLGSQAFLPMSEEPFLVVVAESENDAPVRPRAFLTRPGQGVNYHRGTWHGVLTPLKPGLFTVVDRIGPGNNLEEHWFENPYTILGATNE